MFSRFTSAFCLLFPCVALANLAVVANAPTQIRLRIGATGATITTASVTVAGGNVGSGAAQLTTAPVSARTGSSCAAANFVFFNAEARANPARTATLTANSTSGLSCITPATCGADNIPFTQIGWVNAPPAAYNPATIPSGTFSGAAAQSIISFLSSNQSQDCLRFQYLNTNIVRQGSYTGVVTFTLTMP